MINPTAVQRVGFSFRKMGDNKATHNGAVVTNTTELATVVYSNEVIQVAKCEPRKTPANTSNNQVFPGMLGFIFFQLFNANGRMNSVAKDIRPAAITDEGTSTWAKRIKIDAVETARIPRNNPAKDLVAVDEFDRFAKRIVLLLSDAAFLTKVVRMARILTEITLKTK